jgi:hypothetical protein
MATVPSTHRKKNAACSATLHFSARREHAVGISFQCCITCSSAEYFWSGARARIIGCPKYSKASCGFEPRSLDSESRVLTVTPRGQLTFCQPDTNHGKRTLGILQSYYGAANHQGGRGTSTFEPPRDYNK